MKHKSRAEITTEMLTAYLEGEVTRSEASKIEAELHESPGTRRRLTSLRNIRDALNQSMPEFNDLDLVPSLREALARPAPRATSRRAEPGQVARWWAAAGVILALGLSWVYRHPAKLFAESGASPGAALAFGGEEFRTKSANSLAAAPSRWAGVRVFRVTPNGKPEPLTGPVSTADGFLFSYTNLGNKPFDYLVIFAVDVRKNVRWFYPAYEQPGTNPTSIPIKQVLADVPLPDLIHQDWTPGPVAIHALFSSRPLHVLEVEARIEQAGSVQATREPLNVSDTLDQVTTIELVP